ncbi:MAG: family efflux transporter [Flaviaesturariibacter sp.]|nr:family efflux transporter [Flaviaesturariibacter sp.]
MQALRGDTQDYTKGSLRKAVFMLAIPMIIEMGMESVFALVDLFFVGKLGKHAVSTVGLTESVLTVIYSLAIGASMAATALVARRVGEKNPEGASRTAMQAIWLGLALILVISGTGFYYADRILSFMGAEPETIAIGTTYTRIMMGSSTVIMLLFLINGIFRGAGDASLAMKSLTIANICNIILCPVLVKGLGPVPEMGLTGAAVATCIGRGIGVLYQLYHLFNGRGVVKLTKSSLVLEWGLIRSLVKVGSPATLQFIIASCSWIFLAQLVAETGHSEASAGYQTALRILMFFLLPAWGLSNAAATLVGQSLGAGDPARAEAAVLTTAKYNTLFMASVMLLFLLGARPVVSLFAVQAGVRDVAVTALRIVSCGYIFYGVGMVLTNAFNGAGDTRTPTYINLFGFWAFQIPLAYLLAKYMELGPLGVFIAIPVSETAITIASYILFRKGRWKTVAV